MTRWLLAMTEDRTTGAGTGAAIAVLVAVVIAAVLIMAGYLYLTRDSGETEFGCRDTVEGRMVCE